MLLGLLVQAFAFSSHDDGAGEGPLDLVVIDRAAFVDAVDPVAALLEVFESAVDIGDARDGKVFESSGSGLGNRFREADGAALRNDDGVGSGGMGGADYRAQVVGIFDTVQDYDQSGVCGYFVELGVFGGCAKGDNALMSVVTGETAESAAFFKAHGNVGGAGEVDDFLYARTAGTSGDHDAVESAAGLECFDNGVKTYQNSQGDWTSY